MTVGCNFISKMSITTSTDDGEIRKCSAINLIENAALCKASQDVKIKVPQAVVRGEKAELQCSFDLEGEKLYSVKWYRGEKELFRYAPSDSEPVKVFDSKGVKVKLSDSKEAKIVLDNVTREMSGPFSCEVTADKPSFYTVLKTAHLQVVDVPLREPHITGLKRKYSLEDDNFQANCTSEYSYPAANITWHINGHQLRGPQISKRIINFERYATIISRIQHRITRKLFIHGRMRLRCTASMFNVYNKSTEVTVELLRRNRHPDWLVTTEASTTTLIYEDLSDDEQESSFAAPRKFILWFLSPSSATFDTWPSTVIIITGLVINRILLR